MDTYTYDHVQRIQAYHCTHRVAGAYIRREIPEHGSGFHGAIPAATSSLPGPLIKLFLHSLGPSVNPLSLPLSPTCDIKTCRRLNGPIRLRRGKEGGREAGL